MLACSGAARGQYLIDYLLGDEKMNESNANSMHEMWVVNRLTAVRSHSSNRGEVKGIRTHIVH